VPSFVVFFLDFFLYFFLFRSYFFFFKKKGKERGMIVALLVLFMSCIVVGQDDLLVGEERDLYEEPVLETASELSPQILTNAVSETLRSPSPSENKTTLADALNGLLNKSAFDKGKNGIRGTLVGAARIAAKSLLEKISSQRSRLANLVKQWEKLKVEFVSPKARLDRKRQSEILKQLDNIMKQRSVAQKNLAKLVKEEAVKRTKKSTNRKTSNTSKKRATRSFYHSRPPRRESGSRNPRRKRRAFAENK